VSTVVAVPLNVIAAVQYLSATAKGAEYMRTTLATTAGLQIAAATALVVSTTAGIQVIRRTGSVR
jgi:hypothetical protein